MSAPSLAMERPEGLSPSAWLGRAFGVLILIVFALFFIVPLVWLLLAPAKTDRQLLLEAPFALGDWSTLAGNWMSLVTFQKGLIWTWIGNSAFYCIAALAITLIISIPAGYAMAMTEFRGRRALLAATLIVMLVPSTALVLPIFLELSALKLIGNPLAAILPFSFFPFGVYLAYIYFSTAISRDLLDAARIDGASEVQVFARIAMPLATPVIALVGFFNFTGNWNNFFLPYVTLPGRKAPVQVGLAELLSNVPAFNPTNAASTTISLSTLALATLLAIAPVMIVFLFAQRYLVTGMTAGGTKE
ncbi:MAG: carbohydrate ABC transporter permease [Devosia sp.]